MRLMRPLRDGTLTFRGKEASVVCPSKHLNASQYEVFLNVASADELEHDVLLLSTKRLIHENSSRRHDEAQAFSPESV